MHTNRPSVLRRRLVTSRDGGFTLLEVIVGLVIFLLVAAALVPVLITGAVASQTAKLSTGAKNLTTKQLDSMRSVPFHVAAQNGPFVDVLDEYYVNSSATSITIPTTGGTGKYVASGMVPGQSSNSAYYLVTFSSSSSPNPLPSGYTQSVYTQFLSPNSTGGSTPTGDVVLTPPANYNNNNPTVSQTDSPVSTIIGVTVVTTYVIKGKPHSYKVFTELSDTGHDSPLVVAEAGTEALHVSSSAFDGTGLDAVFGEIGQDATLSHESTAYDSVLNAGFTRSDPAGITSFTPLYEGKNSLTALPNSTSGTNGSSSLCAITALGPSCGGSDCGWGWVGPTSYSDLGATVASAQPRVPQDAEPSGATTFTFSGNGNGGSCGGVGFTNVLPGSPAMNPSLFGASNSQPIVTLKDAPSSSTLMSGSAKVDTPALTFNASGGIANPVVSSANITYSKPVYIFPGLSFVNAPQLPDGSDSNKALLAIKFSSAVSISCNAQSPNAIASYTGTIYVWEQASSSGSGAYQSIPFSFNSGSPTSLPQPGSITVTWSGGSPVSLSRYLASWATGNIVQQQPADGVTGSNDGVHTIPAALSVVTQPTLTDSTGAVDPDTGVVAQVGSVSCVSEDFR